jgi:hypothetical protein
MEVEEKGFIKGSIVDIASSQNERFIKSFELD